MASKPRQMAASAMRIMQVPAYWPVVMGVHGIEKRGVLVDVKKVMAILSMPINVSWCPEIGMECDVELPIAIPDIVMVGELVVDMVMLMSCMLAVARLDLLKKVDTAGPERRVSSKMSLDTRRIQNNMKQVRRKRLGQACGDVPLLSFSRAKCR